VFQPSSIPFWTAIAALAGIGQMIVLIVTARFVWRYLRETEQLRIATRDQVDKAQQLVEAAQQQLTVSQKQVDVGQRQVDASLRQLEALQDQVKASRAQVEAAQNQLEGQIRPAIVARGTEHGVKLFNIGSGPALHVKMSDVLRGSEAQWGAAAMAHDGIPFLEPGPENGLQTIIQIQQNPRYQAAAYLGAHSLQCEYRSLSGCAYATVIDFEGHRAHDTRFYKMESA
jgi:hypothetical protein